MLTIALSRVVHGTEMNNRFDRVRAKDVLGLFASQVELAMVDVFRTPLERTPVDADNALASVQFARQQLPKPTANTGYDYRRRFPGPFAILVPLFSG